MILHIISLCNKIKHKNLYVILGKDSNSIKAILPKNVKIIEQKEQLGYSTRIIMCRRKNKKK